MISNLFDPEFILQQANAEFMEETSETLQQAAALIKSKQALYRIEVKPEAVSMQDFAQLRAERGELLQGLVSFLQAAGPLSQQVPGSLPHLLKMLQWFISGMRGAKQIETVLDDAIRQAEAMAQQQAQNPQGQQGPDPKLQAQMLKGQQDKEKTQAELQADLVREQAKVSADAQREQTQREQNVLEAMQKQLLAGAMKPQDNGGMP